MGCTKAGRLHPQNYSLSHRFPGGIEGCKRDTWKDGKGCNLHLCRFGKWYHDLTCKRRSKHLRQFHNEGPCSTWSYMLRQDRCLAARRRGCNRLHSCGDLEGWLQAPAHPHLLGSHKALLLMTTFLCKSLMKGPQRPAGRCQQPLPICCSTTSADGASSPYARPVFWGRTQTAHIHLTTLSCWEL